MARDQSDSTPIETKDQLIAAIARGCKPRACWRVGTEHEKFGFYTKDLSPIPYGGERGIEHLLSALQDDLKWEPIVDDSKLIGLAGGDTGGAISLEPGGQFELSGAPLCTLHQTCAEANRHLGQLRRLAEPKGIGFLGLGASPKWTLAETPRMPKSRYDIMTRYMPKVGASGLDMMYRTATIQANLDFSSERDMVKKFRVSLALQPIATALFANSPFLESRPNGYQSYRSALWLDTDNARAGMLPFVFAKGFGFEAYVDYALDVPMYFIKRGDHYHDVAGSSFRDLLNGSHPRFPGQTATLSDWNNHLSTIFPEVRLKQFLEMRGADAGSWHTICALPAFWVGLFYDDDALAAAWEMVRDWTVSERQALREGVPRYGLATPFRRQTVLDVARAAVRIARKGLVSRGELDAEGYDETQYLEPLEQTLALGKTPAQRKLDKYHGEWNGNIDRLFREYAY